MKFRIVVLPQAQEDLLRNAEWWAKHQSSDKAAEWLDVVQEQLETIVNFTESHPISQESAEFPYPIRDRRVGLGPRPAFRAVFTIQGDHLAKGAGFDAPIAGWFGAPTDSRESTVWGKFFS